MHDGLDRELPEERGVFQCSPNDWVYASEFFILVYNRKFLKYALRPLSP